MLLAIYMPSYKKNKNCQYGSFCFFLFFSVFFYCPSNSHIVLSLRSALNIVIARRASASVL